jgi:hypothetical protein
MAMAPQPLESLRLEWEREGGWEGEGEEKGEMEVCQ